jgi:hypothetical protein
MEVCKGIILEGKRKGEKCTFPPKEAGYCQKHQRNRIYDQGIAEGKKWCRFFFRGCNNTTEESSCDECRKRLTKKTLDCKHIGCKFKIFEGEFCKKHERDKYRAEEKEKNIKYCDIDRGCFTILKDTKSCDICLEKARNNDNKRHNRNRVINTIAVSRSSNNRICIKCSKDFEVFQTKHLKDSTKCSKCLEDQKNQDKKREDRIRNYKEENINNLESYYKRYINDCKRRGYGDFQINFETFSELVSKPCYYCKYIKDNETNGIDRMNNDIGYIKENCVSCCWKCNRMKHFYHPVFFIEKCKILIKEKEATKEFYKKWSIYYTRSNNKNYTSYKKESLKRNMEFEITQQQWDWLTRSPCYLCGYQDTHGIGIDRVDNNIRKYIFENSRACCGSCNTMKNEMSLQDLLEQCKAISETWSSIELDIPVSKNPLKKSEVKSEDRKHWKSDGIYYAILSDTAESFLETNKDIYSREEFDDLCVLIKSSTKDLAISVLKKLIVKLKQRKNRANKPSI